MDADTTSKRQEASMNYTKPMIDVVREIRRRAPADDKPSIKLANPELLRELIDVYHQTSDNIIRALTRELLNMAGTPWPERLLDQTHLEEHYATRVYRGQTTLVERARLAENKTSSSSEQLSHTTSTVAPKKPIKIYRGQVVA
jgi:hypothetical protein